MKLLVPSVQDTDETVAPCLRAGRGLKQGFLLGHFDFALSPRACVRGAD